MVDVQSFLLTLIQVISSSGRCSKLTIFMTLNNNSGGWCFSASVARNYSLKAMMKWTRHKLCRQAGVPSHWLQTKLDTSAQWCSTTSHNIIMTARRLRGCTEFSPPLIFFLSIHPSPGTCAAGLRSGVTVISLKWMCYSGFWVHVCEYRRDWMWDSCRLSRSYQSPFNVSALWRQRRANYSTGHNTDEFCRRERGD